MKRCLQVGVDVFAELVGHKEGLEEGVEVAGGAFVY